MEDFGKKIVLIAKEKFGLQKKMAETLNLSPSNISEWITGKRKPSFEVLKDLCLKAEISLDWLVIGKTFESDVIDVNLFNDVFDTAFKLAISEQLNINGAYFLGLYDMVKENMEKDSSLTPEQIISKNKKNYCKIKN